VQFEKWLTSTEEMYEMYAEEEEATLSREQLDAHLEDAMRILTASLPSIPSPSNDFLSKLRSFKPPPHDDTLPSALPFLQSVRDFMPSPSNDFTPPKTVQDDLSFVSTDFSKTVTLHKILLAHSMAYHLKNNWEDLTSTTDADVDRAALRGETISSTADTIISLHRLNNVLRSFAFDPCSDRIQALWNLLDADADGLLDQEQMDRVLYASIVPVRQSLNTLLTWSVYVHPIHAPLPPLPSFLRDRPDLLTTVPQQSLSYLAKRRQKKQTLNLLKLFHKNNAFEVEIEMPHRLRCIYAWAEKTHQDNKVDSVLVDSANTTNSTTAAIVAGRKRYVELHPKISHGEFLVEQKAHFEHVDRAGEEYMKSYKEDLWVSQGTVRQNKELKRDCALFLGAVTLVDVFILWL